MKRGHGGLRPGAGRKPLGKRKLKKVLVGLAEKNIQQAKLLGDGNLSLGVRRAIEDTEK